MRGETLFFFTLSGYLLNMFTVRLKQFLMDVEVLINNGLHSHFVSCARLSSQNERMIKEHISTFCFQDLLDDSASCDLCPVPTLSANRDTVLRLSEYVEDKPVEIRACLT